METIYLSPGAAQHVTCSGRIIDATASHQPIALLTLRELEDLRKRASNFAITALVMGAIGFLIGKFWP